MEPTASDSPSAPRTIFRADALRLHAEAHSKPVLPRLTTPFAVACCWLLVALLAAGLGLSWFSRVPAMASGPAVLVDAGVGTVALVFLPPDRVGEVRAGDAVVLRFGTQAVTRPLAAVEPGVRGPDEVRQRFGLSAQAAAAIDQPAIVGTVRLDGLPEDLSAAMYPGAVGRGEVEVGSQRVANLIPGLARFLD